jgi:hypothetical protein
MKKITVFFFLLLSVVLQAQVGVNTTTPDPSSMLDITATNKGVLVPRVNLANVTTSMLDGTNTAATGLLIWNTNAATVGGNGVGFYFFNGTQWIPITQTIPTDADWHEVGTTDAPNDISDDKFTLGNISIGSTAAATTKLDITSDRNSTIRLDNNSVTTGDKNGILNNISTNSTNFETIGLKNAIGGDGSWKTGIENNFSSNSSTNFERGFINRFDLSNSGQKLGYVNLNTPLVATSGLFTGFRNYINENHQGLTYGFFNSITSNSTSDIYGFRNNITTDNDATIYGLHNLVEGTGNSDLYGTYSRLITSGSGDKYGNFIAITGGLGGTSYGVYSSVSGGSTSYAGYFSGRVSIGSNPFNHYILPQSRGTNGQIMQTNATGDVSWVNLPTSSDDQNIQNLAFNTATNVLTVGIENGTSQTVNLSSLNSGGDITAVTAGAGLTGGGITGNVTITVAANNGLNVDAAADNVQLGGPLVENTIISQGTHSLNINLDNSGDFSIQDNGTDVFFVEDTGDIGIGTSNPAYPLHIVENVAATVNGVYIDKADNSTSQTSGLYIQKTGTGTGRSHAIFTNVDGTGTGQKYGIFNNINSSANGNQYGTRNFINSNTSSFIFGTFNNLDNAGTGNQYGVYNGMRGVAAANLYGTYNEFNSPSISNETAGVYNSFSDGTPGSGGIMGVFSEFSNSNNGIYYGSRNSFTNAATGTGTKYGTYNLISAAAGGTHFGTFNEVNQANGWAGYFIGRNYISDRLSIGVTDNPNAALNINKNSTGTYAQIELTEAQANDGARIRFNNSAETTNNWILFGRADDTNSDSTFNIFNNVSGNVVVVNGEGRVGIMRTPATNSLEVNGTASKTVAGSFIANSDSRLKKDITTISPNEALDKILKLRGVTYHWNDDKTGTIRPKKLQMGFIAQEIAEVFPEKVTEDNLGYLQTAYGDYDPIVFQAIKALNEKIENLEKENEALKSALGKINALEAKLDQMNIK